MASGIWRYGASKKCLTNMKNLGTPGKKIDKIEILTGVPVKKMGGYFLFLFWPFPFLVALYTSSTWCVRFHAGCKQSFVWGSVSRFWIWYECGESSSLDHLGSTVWRLLQWSADYHWHFYFRGRRWEPFSITWINRSWRKFCFWQEATVW